ncbi:hypothetical protein CERZMDRAFT_84147 [Cercospora zeae-maydis SCOH1-5]|uniref:Uncharacterized protein n=1 Tax=Cercospora zeae-maydis SCOH1-5 TaxID=717836 RepID=A0A6A6FIU7_9PEZI|nr:hypothetical protein CERZMDRAFT_84147 [Cercospora zeae-maydis SCOH1-5]
MTGDSRLSDPGFVELSKTLNCSLPPQPPTVVRYITTTNILFRLALPLFKGQQTNFFANDGTTHGTFATHSRAIIPPVCQQFAHQGTTPDAIFLRCQPNAISGNTTIVHMTVIITTQTEQTNTNSRCPR